MKSALLIIGLLLFAANVSSANLEFSNGVLVGAKGVVVGGKLYDVSFNEGTCDSIFSECNTSQLAFSTAEDAEIAASALSEQVFLDINDAALDSSPNLTSGCTLLPADGTVPCLLFVPYLITDNIFIKEVSLVYFRNSGPEENDSCCSATYVFNDFDTGQEALPSAGYDAVFAVWSLNNSNPVPSPSTAALLVAVVIGTLPTSRSREFRSRLRASN